MRVAVVFGGLLPALTGVVERSGRARAAPLRGGRER